MSQNQGKSTDLVPLQSSVPATLSSVTSIEQHRAIQEVQGMMIMAKKFPRDENMVREKIIKACQRKSLAEVARYVYPRGGTSVQGPSIRLAETIARLWGNMLYGTQELSRREGASEMEAYAWDLESNTRRSIKFQVDHVRWKKTGSYNLEDPRDIYEMTANMGARRVRACIQGVIPADVFDDAEEECEKTVNANLEGKPEERIASMTAKYQEISVPVEALEKRLGHKIGVTTNPEIIVLRKIFIAIRDGMGKKEDYFELASDSEKKTEEKANALKEKLRKAQAENQGAPAGQIPKPVVEGAEATTEPLSSAPPPAPHPQPAPINYTFDPTTGEPIPVPSTAIDPPTMPTDEEEQPPPPDEPDPWGKKKKGQESQGSGPAGRKGGAGKKAKDYWLSENMVQCPPGGEREGSMVNVKAFCNTTCKQKKGCFLFKD